MKNRIFYYENVVTFLHPVVEEMKGYFNNVVECIEMVVKIALEFVSLYKGENISLWKTALEGDLLELYID